MPALSRCAHFRPSTNFHRKQAAVTAPLLRTLRTALSVFAEPALLPPTDPSPLLHVADTALSVALRYGSAAGVTAVVGLVARCSSGAGQGAGSGRLIPMFGPAAARDLCSARLATAEEAGRLARSGSSGKRAVVAARTAATASAVGGSGDGHIASPSPALPISFSAAVRTPAYSFSSFGTDVSFSRGRRYPAGDADVVQHHHQQQQQAQRGSGGGGSTYDISPPLAVPPVLPLLPQQWSSLLAAVGRLSVVADPSHMASFVAQPVTLRALLPPQLPPSSASQHEQSPSLDILAPNASTLPAQAAPPLHSLNEGTAAAASPFSATALGQPQLNQRRIRAYELAVQSLKAAAAALTSQTAGGESMSIISAGTTTTQSAPSTSAGGGMLVSPADSNRHLPDAFGLEAAAATSVAADNSQAGEDAAAFAIADTLVRRGVPWRQARQSVSTWYGARVELASVAAQTAAVGEAAAAAGGVAPPTASAGLHDAFHAFDDLQGALEVLVTAYAAASAEGREAARQTREAAHGRKGPRLQQDLQQRQQWQPTQASPATTTNTTSSSASGTPGRSASAITGHNSEQAVPDSTYWALLIEACAAAGQPRRALRVMAAASSSGRTPTRRAYGAVITALARGGGIGDAEAAEVALCAAEETPGCEPMPATDLAVMRAWATATSSSAASGGGGGGGGGSTHTRVLAILRQAQARGMLVGVDTNAYAGIWNLSGLPREALATVLWDGLRALKRGVAARTLPPPLTLRVYHSAADRLHIRSLLASLSPPLQAVAWGASREQRHLFVSAAELVAWLTAPDPAALEGRAATDPQQQQIIGMPHSGRSGQQAQRASAAGGPLSLQLASSSSPRPALQWATRVGSSGAASTLDAAATAAAAAAAVTSGSIAAAGGWASSALAPQQHSPAGLKHSSEDKEIRRARSTFFGLSLVPQQKPVEQQRREQLQLQHHLRQQRDREHIDYSVLAADAAVTPHARGRGVRRVARGVGEAAGRRRGGVPRGGPGPSYRL